MIIETYGNFDEAWHKINYSFLGKRQKVSDELAGTRNFSYDNTITLNDYSMDMDIGKATGYGNLKWPYLLYSYLDREQLIWLRKKLYNKYYGGQSVITLGYAFKSSRKTNGACLIGFTFSLEKKSSILRIHFYSRISEVTRRMLFDYAMFNRIIHYLFNDEILSIYKVKVRVCSHALYQGASVAPILAPVFNFDKLGFSREKKTLPGYLGMVELAWRRYQLRLPQKFSQAKRIQMVVNDDTDGKKRRSIYVKDLKFMDIVND